MVVIVETMVDGNLQVQVGVIGVMQMEQHVTHQVDMYKFVSMKHVKV